METRINQLKSFESLQEMTGTGWWAADLQARTLFFSSFLVKKLELENDKLSFETFKSRLHPESAEKVLRTMRVMFAQQKKGELEFLFNTAGEYRYVRLKINDRIFENDKLVAVEGFIQCLDCPDTASAFVKTNQELNRLLRWQKTFTHSLRGLLEGVTDAKALTRMLELIRQYFHADAIRIYEVDYNDHRLNCMCESTAEHVSPIKDLLQNLKLENSYWRDQILSLKSGFCDEVPKEFYAESTMQYQQAKAFMAIPLISAKGNMGFIKLDMLDRPRKWTYLEKELFQSIVNILGVCLSLRQSESQALEHNDFLHKLFQNMPLGYFSLRIEQNEEGKVVDYEYLDVNKKLTEMVGLSREQLVGKMHTEIGPIFVDKLDLQVLARVAFQGEVFYTRGQMRYNKRYYNTTIYCPRRGDIVALFSDVTDTVLASEALKHSEQELKKVYTNIPVGIEIYDKNGVMVEVNDKELEIQGVTDKNVLLGLNLFDHPSLPKFAYDMLREGKDVTFDVTAESMRVNHEYYGIANPYITKYLTIKCTLLFNAQGEVEHYLLIVIDNTEMYQKSAQVREFEAMFNTVAQIAEIGIFKWNPLRNDYFNTDQYLRNMGLTQEESKNFLIYKDKVHPNDVGVLEQFLEDAVAGNTKSITHEFRVRDGEGWKWLRTACFISEYDPENNNVQFLGVNYNINEMKVAEQKLFEAKSKAEEADRLKTAFLANMSHEIRTPLNAIVGFSGILAETDDKEDKAQFMSIIKKNNDHLLNLISDILDISKIEAGTVDINTGYLMAEDICDQVIESLSIKNEMGLDMRFIPNEDNPNVLMESDGKRITQILSNYLANALKFTRQGHVWLSYKVLDKEIEFSVEDTGVGIAEENLGRLFERFFKVDEFIPGTGLGLSICKNIADRLEGKVGVESTLGKGSRFWLRLPLMFQFF